MNKGRKTTKTCIQCLKQVPSARKSCIQCGFLFSRGNEGSKHPIERAKRRCREKPNYFDSLEFCTTISKKRKTLVKKQSCLTSSSLKDESQKNVEVEEKPPSEVSNSTESSESIPSHINKDEDICPRFSTEKTIHYSNILSEINRKLSSVSSQPPI